MHEFDQMILIDKPAGMTSFGVVARVRRVLSARAGKKVKVGHTGTLDPFATGLLILMSGKMTRRCQEFLKLDKVYEATLRLGQTSTTDDPEGIIRNYWDSAEPGKASSSAETPVATGVSDACPKIPNIPSVLQVLKSFEGEQLQTPPAFSAIKINGQRAYKLARAGEKVEIPTRKITIYSIELISYSYPELKIRCHVSSGTYVRTLGRDIGEKLGTGAYLTALRRLKIGDYDVKDAASLSSFGITD